MNRFTRWLRARTDKQETPHRKKRTPKQQLFPFFALPREIRDQIYKEVLTRPNLNEIWIRYSLNRNKWYDATPFCNCPGELKDFQRTRPLDIALLSTCRTVYEEALPILYENNNIWLDGPPARVLEFLSALPEPAMMSIRYLKLWMDAYPECGRIFVNPSQLSPDAAAIMNSRMQSELLSPWLDLFTFIQKNLGRLHTLHVWTGSNHARRANNVRAVSTEWHDFYSRGWMERVRETPRIANLLVEAECRECDIVDEVDHTSFRRLRSDLCRVSGFEEISADWDSYFIFSGDVGVYISGRWPKARLLLSMARNDSLQSRDDGEEVALLPLPEFEKKYTLDDATSLVSCNMGFAQLIRTPDNNR